jgi:hypothetical protein
MTYRTVTITLFSIAISLLGAYIWFSANTIALGYRLDDKNAELGGLIERANDLIIEIANRQNPTSLLEQAKVLNLVEDTSISGYIDTTGPNLGLDIVR